MELTCAFLQGNHRIVNGVSVIGRNTTDEVWMFSPSTQLDRDGNWVECNNSRFVWLPSANGLEGEKRLHCTICMPLDDGEALKDLYAAVEAFMPDNAIAVCSLAVQKVCIVCTKQRKTTQDSFCLTGSRLSKQEWYTNVTTSSDDLLISCSHYA